MTRRVFESFDIKGGWWLNVILMVLSSVILMGWSVYVYLFIQRSVEEQKVLDFNQMVQNHLINIQSQTKTAVDYLYDLSGYLTVQKVNDAGWKNYISASGLNERYPSFLSLVYAEMVNKENLPEYIDTLKKENIGPEYKSYVVFPETGNKEVYPIKYIYSNDNEIMTLLGYDVGSSENISGTMMETVISGRGQISPLLNFNRILSASTRTGYAIVLPVYNQVGALTMPPDQLRKYLVGFVGGFVRPDELFLGSSSNTAKEFAITVFDQGQEVYNYQNDLKKGNLHITRDVNILGKTFNITFDSIASFSLPPIVDSLSKGSVLGLIILNVFWYLTIMALLLARARSLRITKDATEDLRKFKQAVDGVSDLVIITDEKGEILYVNDAIVKATGFSRNEIIGKRPSLWGGQMDKEFYENFWKTIKVNKKPFWGELKNKRKNGDFYEVELNVWPILNEKGEVIYYVGIEKDITKTKAVERMKTEFISLASHQLRTPLSAVKWFGKMLMDGEAGELSKTQKEYLNKIYDSNEREIQLVNSLLNVSRIESGRIKIEPKETDLKQLVSSVISDIEVGLSNSVRRIKLTAEDDLPLMKVDPDLMRHVYLNLLTNAVRYTKENGKIEVDLSVKDGNLVTKITDDGIGIPQPEQERIFEKFFRGSNALKKETDGSGLGLYLAKSVVDSSGGKIWFKSKENMGTTFWFTLPVIPKV